jgi:hypothetical protein
MGTASNVFFCHREFGDGPTPMDKRFEYHLLYVHILSGKINKTACFSLTPEPLNKLLAKVAHVFYVCSCAPIPEESAQPIVFAFPSRVAGG